MNRKKREGTGPTSLHIEPGSKDNAKDMLK